jgi:hypothetical protein
MPYFVTRPAPNAMAIPIDCSPARVRALVGMVQANTQQLGGPRKRATKAHVAALLGVTRSQLNQWMRGENTSRQVGGARRYSAPYCAVYCLEALAYNPEAAYGTFWRGREHG